MWSLLITAGKWLLGLIFGPKSDPAVLGEKLGIAETNAAAGGAEIADVHKAQSAADDVDARLARDPDSLRERSEFSRD